MAERKNVSALDLLDQLPARARVVVLPPATDDDPHPGPKAAPTSLFAATRAGLTPEQVRNVVAAFVEAGAGISINHDDEAGTLTVTLEIPPATINIEDLAAAVVARLLPTGGTANQALAKSADNSAVAWRAVPTLIANGSITVGKLAAALVARLLPTGGSNGQFLGRSSGAPAWVAAPAGMGGGTDATAREGVQENAAALNAVDYVVDRFAIVMRALTSWSVGDFADAGTAETDAGFAIGFWELPNRPSAYDDLTWQATHVDVDASTGYFFAVRVPSGFPVEDFIRIQQRRTGASFNWPGQAGEWLPFALTGAPKHYDIYALMDSPTALTGIEANANDDFALQIAGASYFDPTQGISMSVRDLHDLVDSIAIRTGAITNFATLPSRGHFRVGWTAIAADGTQSGVEHSGNTNPDIIHAANAGNRVIVHWTPAGTDPETRRVVHRRSGSVVATYPRSGEYWRSYQSVRDAVSQVVGHFDAWFLASETSDAPVAVALQEGDQLVLQAGESTEIVQIPENALAAAIRAKLLPLLDSGGADAGKFPQVNQAGTGYELTDGPTVPESFDEIQGMVADNQIPPGITRDTEVQDSLTGLALAGRTLTATRRSGSNPVEVMLPEGGGGVEGGRVLKELGRWTTTADISAATAAVNNASGITLPANPSDDEIFLFVTSFGAGEPIVRAKTGRTIKALMVQEAGSGGEETSLALDPDGNIIYGSKTAANELLLSTDVPTGFRANDFFTLYELVEGTAAAGGGGGGDANPEYTTIRTVNTGTSSGSTRGRFQTSTLGSPIGDATNKATPHKIGLVSSGSELSEFASGLDETEDEITLDAGTYIAHFHIGMYSGNSGTGRLSSNQRMNTYHDARMDIDGTEETISHLLSNSYIRPIGGTDGAYGAFTRSTILRVPEKGAVSFRHASTGQSAAGYLGCREIVLFKIGGSAAAAGGGGAGGGPEPTGLEARLHSLEDKTADVTFDPDVQQTWTPAANALASGLYPLGRWRFIANGAAAASYAGLDYSAAGWENDDGLTGAVENAGICWVVPNNITWSRTRLVILAADGTVKRTIVAQSLRNMPSARVPSNLPAGPPDHTARWLATSDTHPLSIGTLEATDRVALQVLADTHTPIWRGEIDNGFSQRVSRDTAGLKALTADLTAGGVATGFANVAADGSEGGLVMLDAFPSLADARGVAAGRYSVRVSGVANIVDEYVLVRVPAGTHPAQARVFVTQSHGLDDFGDTLNVMVHLGQTADSMWELYADRRQWDAFTDTVTLQVTASAEHVGSTVFSGEISDRIRERVKAAEDALAAAQAMIDGHLLADFPAAGARNGLMARFQGDVLGWHTAIGEIEELASRRQITGGWTIPGGMRLNGNNTITQSGTTLYINAQAALQSNTLGVIIEVTRTNHSTKVFIPWALFRTGSGNYVSGGGHGTQGIPAGYWTVSSNSILVAMADWAEEHGRFELTVRGEHTDQLSVLRVWSAR